MNLDMPTYLANRRTFLSNRAAIPVEQLAQFAGRWVAWSPDGTRIVASADDPGALDSMVAARGEDPAECVIEGIPGDGALFGQTDGSGA